jgi:hypothetical protein
VSELIDLRFETAKRYLLLLKKSFYRRWDESYLVAVQSNDWLMLLALVHPDHYRVEVFGDRPGCQIRGPRSFAREAGMGGLACASDQVWGYACQCREDDQLLRADHLFPYALGGPTEAANKVYLCRFHNDLKGCDIHCYPWERGEPSWLHAVVKRVARIKRVKV